MLVLNETDDHFSRLIREYKQQAEQLFSNLTLRGTPVSLNACNNAFESGLDNDAIYLIKGGMLHCRHDDRSLFTCDEGDVINARLVSEIDQLILSADGPVLLKRYDAEELMAAINGDMAQLSCWNRLQEIQQLLLTRLLAVRTQPSVIAKPGFAYFEPGDVIIRQGETAYDVFSLFDGSAEVSVNGVKVGEVTEGEILGAMAVLTNSLRSATVTAKTRCGVVKVPREQFDGLIRTKPTMIHRLLVEMAEQIQLMNQRVVAKQHQSAS